MALSGHTTKERKICIKLVHRLSKKLHADGFLGVMLGYTGSGDEGSAGDTVACKSAQMPKLTQQLVWDDDAEAVFEDPVRTGLLTEYEFASANHYNFWLRDNANAAELKVVIGQQSGVYPTINALLKALLSAFIPWWYSAAFWYHSFGLFAFEEAIGPVIQIGASVRPTRSVAETWTSYAVKTKTNVWGAIADSRSVLRCLQLKGNHSWMHGHAQKLSEDRSLRKFSTNAVEAGV